MLPAHLNPMPTDAEADAEPRRVNSWNTLLDQLDAEGISDEDAHTLVRLFPVDGSDCYGLAWTLVHVIETAPSWPIGDALDQADGYWPGILRQRIA